MKNILLSLLFVVVPVISNAQAPPIQWQKCLGGTSADGGLRIRPALEGGYVISGYTNSTNGDITAWKGGSDFWIVKINDTGGITWQRTLGGTGLDAGGVDIRQTSDSGFIVIGHTGSNDSDVTGYHGAQDIWVVKLSKTGSLQWQHCLGGSQHDEGLSILQNADSSFIVAGVVRSNDGDVSSNHGQEDIWVVKLSPTGAIVWQKTYGGTRTEGVSVIEHTNDCGYIMAGFTNSNNGDVTFNHGPVLTTDAWIVKISSTGSLQWQRSFGGTSDDKAKDIRQTADGGYIVLGSAASNDGDVSGGNGNQDYWLFKLNNTGSMLWQHTFGGTNWDIAYSFQQTSDSGFIIAGNTFSNDSDVSGNHGNNDYWVVKTSSTGNLQWQRCFGGSDWENYAAAPIAVTTDNGYIFCGDTRSNNGDVIGNHGGQDMWVVKIGPDSLLTHFNGIGHITNSNTISIFPNPADDIIHISGADKAVKRLYNMYGQLQKEERTKSISIAEFSPGLYLIRIFDEQGQLIHQERILKQ